MPQNMAHSWVSFLVYNTRMSRQHPNTSWSKVSHWYSDLVGEGGHYFHSHLILPRVLKLLDLQPTDELVDLGCGEGVLERAIPKEVGYLGVDIADGLLKAARQKVKATQHRFLQANLTRKVDFPKQFTKAVSILALQNMENGAQCIKNAAHALQTDGMLILVLNHPCFRIPRQTSWGIDEKNKLQYRRVNRYFAELKIPIQMHPGQHQQKQTWSFHHPLSQYFSWLKQSGFVVDDLQEWTSEKESQGKAAKMENRARSEFPMFLCIVARKQK